MSNWCNNSLIVNGKKEDLEVFKAKYKGTFTEKKTDITWLDFTKIIPNQKNKDKWKPKFEELTTEEKTRWDNDFEHYWFNKSGSYWQNTNWGTKWNPDVSEPQDYKDGLNYGFQTAWSPCDQIVKTLIKKHPELEFELEFEEWGMRFMGEVTGKNGEVMTDIAENCEIQECPDCESTTLKPDSQEKFECGECGKIFTKEESEKAEKERENEQAV